MKRWLSLLLTVVLLCSTCLMSACGGGADPTTPPTTTPSDPTPGGSSSSSTTTSSTPASSTTTTTNSGGEDPTPVETLSLNATQRVVYTPAVSFGDPSYNAYYMEAMTVLDFRDRLTGVLGFRMPAKDAPAPITRTGIDARIDSTMDQNKWTVSVGADKIIYVRAGHYAALEAGLDNLYQKVKETNNKIPVNYTASGNVWVTAAGVNNIFANYGATGNYKLVWNDEFNTLNYERWTFSDENPVKAGVIRSNSAFVENGNLIVRAQKASNETMFYTSNLVTTYDTMNFHGGYLEMRAKVPFQDIGEFVSLWATTGRAVLFMGEWWRDGNTGTPENSANGGFGVEVDIFEVFSSTESLKPDIWFWQNGKRVSQLEAYGEGSRSYLVPGDPNDYHIYSFYWNDDWMVFAIDSVPYMAVSMAESVRGSTEYYSKERSALSLRLQNDVFTPQYCQSNSWANSNKADGNASYKSDFVIDYIRLYQCEEDILYLPEELGNGDESFNYAKAYRSYWMN